MLVSAAGRDNVKGIDNLRYVDWHLHNVLICDQIVNGIRADY
jgi:hypothetical protein